jgi:hypothetical protein
MNPSHLEVTHRLLTHAHNLKQNGAKDFTREDNGDYVLPHSDPAVGTTRISDNGHGWTAYRQAPVYAHDTEYFYYPDQGFGASPDEAVRNHAALVHRGLTNYLANKPVVKLAYGKNTEVVNRWEHAHPDMIRHEVERALGHFNKARVDDSLVEKFPQHLQPRMKQLLRNTRSKKGRDPLDPQTRMLHGTSLSDKLRAAHHKVTSAVTVATTMAKAIDILEREDLL